MVAPLWAVGDGGAAWESAEGLPEHSCALRVPVGIHDPAGLAEFLADHLMLSPIEAADFFQRSYSFAGLARLASQHSEVALTYLPILIELGDVGINL